MFIVKRARDAMNRNSVKQPRECKPLQQNSDQKQKVQDDQQFQPS